MILWLDFYCFGELLTSLLSAFQYRWRPQVATYIASSKFFAAKALLPSALRASAMRKKALKLGFQRRDAKGRGLDRGRISSKSDVYSTILVETRRIDRHSCQGSFCRTQGWPREGGSGSRANDAPHTKCLSCAKRIVAPQHGVSGEEESGE